MKSLLETLLDDEIIENRPRKNDKSGKSYYIVDNENTDKNSDSKTESEISNLDSKANEPSLKTVFSSSNNEESNSIKSVNDKLLQHLLEENKTKNDIIKILVGNFSVNVNKPQQISLYNDLTTI